MEERIIPKEISIYIDEATDNAVAKASIEFQRYVNILDEKFQDKLDIVIEGFNSHSERLDRIENILEDYNERFNRIDNVLTVHGDQLKELTARTADNTHQIKGLREALSIHSLL